MNYLEYVPNQPEWLKDRVIFACRYGSHAYGTSTPESDLDIRGIAIPPKEYFLGFSLVFDQSVASTPADIVIFGLKKFISLAADCNPSIIEILWVDSSDVLYEHPLGTKLRENRSLFLSQKAKHTFCGYAISQLKRIKTHRKWLLNPPQKEPDRKDFDLPERRVLSQDQQGVAFARIQQLIDSWELDLSDLDDARRIHIMEQLAKVVDEKTCDEFHRAGKLLGFEDNLLEYLEKEKKYQSSRREWEQYHLWKKTRNPARAKTEAESGYDRKHASHLVRLMRMCREILTEGVVKVKRPDAEELLAIKNGAWTYDQIVEFAEKEDEALVPIMKASKLPKAPPRDKLDKLCMEIAEESFRCMT